MSSHETPPKILFIHGLESGPQGTKARHLQSCGFDVHSPDMQMSLMRLERENSIARHVSQNTEVRLWALGAAFWSGAVLSRRSLDLFLAGAGLFAGWGLMRHRDWIGQGVQVSMERCIEIQAQAIRAYQPQIVIGSSWGGAVALELVRIGIWDGPTILLAPAYHRVLSWSQLPDTERYMDQLCHACDSEKMMMFHDLFDETVPHADAVELSYKTKIPLHSVEAGGHRLLGILEDGSLEASILELLSSSGV